jgi:hypothetical protein
LRQLLAITAVCWMGVAQAQALEPVAAATPIELSFRDFFQTPVGPAGLAISDALRQADGQNVRLVGYMVQQESPAPGRFFLTPRPVQMSENADGDADDLPPATVVVYLADEQKDWKVPHVRGLLSVVGQLSVRRREESGGRVSWVHLQLGADATRGMNSFELAAYLHQLQHRH